MSHFVYQGKTNSTHRRVAGNRPTVSPLYDFRGGRKYLTHSERNAFLAVASQMPPGVRTFCRTLAYTGARISEVLAITPRRIDMDVRVVVIESLKKRRRGIYRAVPIPAALIEELDRIHNIRQANRRADRIDERLWTWCRTSAWHAVKTCMDLAGIEGAPASPKGLRHTFAVEALKAGVPINLVKRWLGHSRLETTVVYTEAVGDEEEFIASRFWKTF